jgi:general secretion pathway protein G
MRQKFLARRLARAAGTAEAGMTLLEVMIVLAIIGIIAGTVGVGLFSRFRSGQVKTAKVQVTEIAHAAEQYMMDHSSNCPASLDDMVASKHLGKKFKDPWGRDFVLRCPGQVNTDGVDVLSSGPDKQEGTADDVKSWD